MEPVYSPDRAVPIEEPEYDPNRAIAVPEERQSALYEDRGQVIDFPDNYDEKEMDYSVATDIDQESKSDFFGMLNYGKNMAVNFGKGFEHFLLSMPQVAGSALKEAGMTAEARRDESPAIAAARRTFDMAISPGNMNKVMINKVLEQGNIPDILKEAGQKLIDMNQRFLKSAAIEPTEDTGAPKVAFDIGSAIGSTAASIGLVYLTKNPTAVAGLFGAMQKASIFEEAVSEGKTAQEASVISSGAGAAEGILEFAGLHVFFETLKASKPLAKIALRSLTEGVQEGSQQLAEEGIAKLTGLRDESMTSVAKRVAYATALGLVAGAPVATISTFAENMGVQKDLKKMGLSDAEVEAAITKISNKQINAGLPEEVASIINKETSGLVMPDAERQKGYAEVQKELAKAMPEQAEPETSLGDLGVDFKPSEKSGLPTFEQRAKEILGQEVKREDVLKQIQDKKVQAKLVELDEKAAELNESLTYLEKRQAILKKKGKDPLSLANVTNMIKEGRREFKVVDSERGDILTSVAENINFEKEKLKFTGQQVTDIGLQQKIAGFKSGIKAGKTISQEMFKETQESLREFLKSTEMNPTEKAKFLSTKQVDAIKTPQQLANKIDDISTRVDEIVNERKAKVLKEKIKSLLSGTKTRTEGGKPIGKFTPEIQTTLDQVREISEMTQKDARAKLLENLIAIGDELPTDQQRLENHLLETMSGFNKRNPQELSDILDQLDAIASTGRAESILAKFTRQESQLKDKEKGLEVLTGGKPIDETRKETLRKKAFRSFITAGKSLSSSWTNLLNQLSAYDKTSKSDESFLSKKFDTIKIEIEERASVQKLAEQVSKRGQEIFGLKSEFNFAKKIHSDMAEEISGVFRFSDGKDRLLTMSRAQMRKRWMELQDPTLHDALFNPESNAYTPQIVEWIESNLSNQDKEFATAQLDFYRSYYKTVNEVYKRQYGVNLPFNEFYSPIRRDVDKDIVQNPLQQEALAYASFIPGSFKSRQANYRPFKDMNDWEVLNRHILQMEHFRHWSDMIRDMNAFFSDGQVRRTIDTQFGPDIINVIDASIRDFKSRGQRMSESWEKWIDIMRTGKVVSALGGKIAQIPKQMTGIFGYAEFVSPREFVTGMADFISNPKAAIETLSKSKLIKLMDGNITQEFVGLMSSEEARNFLSKPNIKNGIHIWMSTVRYGAKAGNIIGGWPVYKATLERTGSEQEAMDAFESALAKTQPTSLLSSLSQWQKGNSLQRLFSLFTSAQNKYFQREMTAIRDAIAGRATPQQLAKVILIHHVIIPSLFQWISDGFKWDDEEQTRAMLTGPLNGVFIFGDMVDMFIRAALNEAAGFELNRYPSTNQLMEPVEGLTRAMHKMDIEDIDMESFLEGLKVIATDVVGPTTGLPTKMIFDSIPSGVSDIVDEDETVRALLKFGGWAPAHIDKIYDK